MIADNVLAITCFNFIKLLGRAKITIYTGTCEVITRNISGYGHMRLIDFAEPGKRQISTILSV